MHRNSYQQHYGRLISMSMPCPGVSPADLLHVARGQPRSYWESARDGIAFAGMGIAIELMAWGSNRFAGIEQQARALFEHAIIIDEHEPLAAPRLFGGFSFRDDFVPDLAWADFPPAHFVLPHYQLVRVRDSFWLTLNVHAPLNEDPHMLATDLREALLAQIDRLQSVSSSSAARHSSGRVVYPMPFDQWSRSVERIVQQIRTGVLKKVVLARIAEASFDEPADIDGALAENQPMPDRAQNRRGMKSHRRDAVQRAARVHRL